MKHYVHTHTHTRKKQLTNEPTNEVANKCEQKQRRMKKKSIDEQVLFGFDESYSRPCETALTTSNDVVCRFW